MIFTELDLAGAYVLDLERREDERGFFARAWCANELAEHGLETRLVQANVAFNRLKGTVRGMHMQEPPHAEVKLIRATRGAVYDVIVDVRPGSPTRGRWAGVELSAANGRALYVPEGFAHGYQTLVDGAELLYSTSAVYAPDSACGVRYDDPRFGIRWLLPVSRISDQDRTWPDFGPGHPAFEAR